MNNFPGCRNNNLDISTPCGEIQLKVRPLWPRVRYQFLLFFLLLLLSVPIACHNISLLHRYGCFTIICGYTFDCGKSPYRSCACQPLPAVRYLWVNLIKNIKSNITQENWACRISPPPPPPPPPWMFHKKYCVDETIGFSLCGMNACFLFLYMLNDILYWQEKKFVLGGTNLS